MTGTIATATLVGLLAGLLVSNVTIKTIQRLRIGQQIRQVGPKSHYDRAGTPTMGGVIIMMGALASAAVHASALSWRGWAVLAVGMACGGLGGLDDALKLIGRSHDGLKPRYKMLGLILIGVAFMAGLAFAPGGLPTLQAVPWLGSISLGALVVGAIGVVVIVGTTNAVNLSDGMDGLAGGACAVVFFAAALLPLSLSFAHGDVAVISAGAAGGCLAFVCVNAHPARVFMGDSGSFFLGGMVATTAILQGAVFLLPIAGVLFVIEALSVIAQVGSYKLRNKKRVLRMAPIHHHWELGGVPEPRLVARLWILTVAGCLLAAWSIAS